MQTIRICITAFILCAATLACNASDPSGVWKFEFEGPRGRKLESTLTLKLDGGRLGGAIDNRGGRVKISDARLEGDQVSFNVVHKIRLRKFAINYSGRLDGDTIKGTVSTKARDGGMRSREWEARRSKHPPRFMPAWSRASAWWRWHPRAHQYRCHRHEAHCCCVAPGQN
ncbi:MAG: hypothetical protein LBC18_01045 [Opitutaceae bacterium]|jgi:hypothetical protein|nr:hypothetical protein [Opitutaceae bacterium]